MSLVETESFENLNTFEENENEESGMRRKVRAKVGKTQQSTKVTDIARLLDTETLNIIQAAIVLRFYESLADFVVKAVKREAERFSEKHGVKNTTSR